MASSSLEYCLNFSKENELKDFQDTKVEGKLPVWLKGALVRNGPGIFQVGETAVRHLFDGMACLHKFLLEEGGRVRYQCRVLDTETWRRCQEAQCLIATQFGTARVPDPCKNIFSRRFSYYFGAMPMDNTCVNVLAQGDRLLAFTETAAVSVVEPQSLQWRSTVDLSGVVAVRLATAHPHLDPRDGCLYNLGTDFNPRQAYSIVRVPPRSEAHPEPLTKAKVVAKVASRWLGDISYNHSFGMSENYFVILEQNLTMKTLKFAALRLSGSSLEDCMAHHKDHETLLHVVRKEDGKELPIKYAADPFFCFHFVNCYEEGGFLVVDLVAYRTSDIVKNLYLDSLQVDPSVLEQDPPRYRRYVLPLERGKAEVGEDLVAAAAQRGKASLSSEATARPRSNGTIHLQPEIMFEKDNVRIELPRINSEKHTKKHRFAYGTSFVAESSELYKVDVQKKTSMTWKEDGFVAGEPIFVPRPEKNLDEDDGVVLSTLMSKREESQGFLLVLDARTFAELGRACIPQGARIPVSFHGSFLPQQAPDQQPADSEALSSVSLL